MRAICRPERRNERTRACLRPASFADRRPDMGVPLMDEQLLVGSRGNLITLELAK
jgi:hypothetical protein